ncbi:hypothetical protein GTO10_01905 [Candidatus Saccharibacteria bacterium]|nr:hypothetical protein [Candidatus Saccharibacteria bacterium]
MEDAIITKIEGHGRLRTDWRKNEVVLEVTESERLFEGIVVGRPAAEAPWITARICGVCPTAHNICAFKAIEDALGVKPDETTVLLRKLHLDAQMIQSHALHLYFLSFPDYLGIDSGLELKDSHPKHFKAALTLKEVSDEIAFIVGGRSTHPTTTTIGSYLKYPAQGELKKLAKKLDRALKAGIETAHLASNLKYPKLKSPLLSLSQINEEGTYNIYESPKVKPSGAPSWVSEDYRKEIGEALRDFSTAKFGFYRGRPAMVGALPRIAIQGKLLFPKAKKLLLQSKIDLMNPFNNNLAQAIEIVHFTEEAIEMVKALSENVTIKKDKSFTQIPELKSPQTGVGALEAPRGGLYHEYTVDAKGIITEANIITPTVQNLGALERASKDLVAQTKNLKKERREKLLEMLVRAFDPCITCSVH